MRKKLVPSQIAFEINLVPPLEYVEARHENPEREQASPEAIKATLSKLIELGDRQSADILILQVLTGARPGELCNSTVGEFRKTGEDVWTFVPNHHKTKWKDKKREISLGEEEQKILEKYLAGKKENDPVFCNLHRYKNRAISERSYSDTIKETQKKHGLEKFTPYQVRHTNGTWIGEVLDIDHARAQLGHTSTQTTKRYVHADTQKQLAVLEKRKAVGSAIGNAFEFIGQPPSTALHHPALLPNLQSAHKFFASTLLATYKSPGGVMDFADFLFSENIKLARRSNPRFSNA